MLSSEAKCAPTTRKKLQDRVSGINNDQPLVVECRAVGT